jgi:hypothetical protein
MNQPISVVGPKLDKDGISLLLSHPSLIQFGEIRP